MRKLTAMFIHQKQPREAISIAAEMAIEKVSTVKHLKLRRPVVIESQLKNRGDGRPLRVDAPQRTI